jgi:hypothetical protein
LSQKRKNNGKKGFLNDSEFNKKLRLQNIWLVPILFQILATVTLLISTFVLQKEKVNFCSKMLQEQKVALECVHEENVKNLQNFWGEKAKAVSDRY